jgi:hypothetical protein
MTVGLLFIYNKQESKAKCIANEAGEPRTPARSLRGEENGVLSLPFALS